MLEKYFKNKKVLITGHTGFKGTWLTVWLKKMGAEIIGVSKDYPTSPSMFQALGLADQIEHHLFDIRNYNQVYELISISRPDFIFHLAAQPIVVKSYDDPIETFTTNIIGTMNVLNSVRYVNHPVICIMITSDKCYENVEWIWGYRENDRLGGKDPYSASKASAEIIIRSYFQSFFNYSDSFVKLASVRAGNVIGGGDWAENRIIPDIIKAWTKNQPVNIRNPNSTRPWQHVLEPLSGYLITAAKLVDGQEKVNGESFNFGPNSNQIHSVKEVYDYMHKLWFDNKEHLKESSVFEENKGKYEAGLLRLNCDKANTLLGWSPVFDFIKTLSFINDWYSFYYSTKNNSTSLYNLTTSQIEDFEKEAKTKLLI